MHPKLLEGLDRARRVCQDDKRCLAMFLWGSAGKSAADEFSDIDVAVVVRDDDYQTLKKDVPAMCEHTFGQLVAWIPEGEQAEHVNYAFLFREGDELLLCDLMVVSEKWITANRGWVSDQILFDRDGLLAKLSAERERAGAGFSAAKLLERIHEYWIYVYLNGKHFRRSNVFKLFHTQHALFERHLSVLRFFYPDLGWNSWAAKDVYLLPEAHQERLLIYCAGARLDTIGDVLRREMDLFTEDARQACNRYDVEYTNELERSVREHLRRMNVT